ncbi:MAG: sterol desaturase family protein [Pseudomonadota bacterium]
MEATLEAFGGSILLASMIGVLLFAAVVEMLLPRRTETPRLLQRWTTNIGLAFLNHYIVKGAAALATFLTAYEAQTLQFGLLNHVSAGFGVALVITVLALDLGSYVYHRIMHAVPWLWRIHAVHHCDTEVDFTTSYRHHPVEAIISVFFAVPIVLVLGLPPLAIVAYQVLATVINVLSHSNIGIPESLEKAFSRVLVTPDFHRLHHASERRHTDSNFGSVFPWFDYALGTATRRPFEDHRTIELGLEYFRDPGDSRLDRLLLMPIRWRRGKDVVSGAGLDVA